MQVEPPASEKPSFTCLHCRVAARQRWGSMVFGSHAVPGYRLAVCDNCGNVSIWRDARLVYPDVSTAPEPHPDMPVSVRSDFEEARAIVDRSPRGAAALLRLVVQKLMVEFGEPGKDINKDIGSLVAKGMSKRVQRACDAVRIVGNSSVHPGEIDLNDEPQLATALFKFINLIIETQIAEEKAVSEIYEALPESKRQQVERRDGT